MENKTISKELLIRTKAVSGGINNNREHIRFLTVVNISKPNLGFVFV